MVRTFRRFSTPAGPIAYALDDTGAVTHLQLLGDNAPLEVVLECEGYVALPADERAKEVEDQILEFLCGSRKDFELMTGVRGTPFQRRVWQALREIPYGETRSTKELAQSIGHPKSVRAVEAARVANPVRLVIPCHRVISDHSGTLQEMQTRLLGLEKGQTSFDHDMPEATGSIEEDRLLGYLL